MEKRIDGAEQDVSLKDLNDLLANGFDEVEWVWESRDRTCKCSELNGLKWTLSDFITNLRHDAPIFEHSHVNCHCHIIVRNLTTGEEQKVNFSGIVY
jgi:hypothetical protein